MDQATEAYFGFDCVGLRLHDRDRFDTALYALSAVIRDAEFFSVQSICWEPAAQIPVLIMGWSDPRLTRFLHLIRQRLLAHDQYPRLRLVTVNGHHAIDFWTRSSLELEYDYPTAQPQHRSI